MHQCRNCISLSTSLNYVLLFNTYIIFTNENDNSIFVEDMLWGTLHPDQFEIHLMIQYILVINQIKLFCVNPLLLWSVYIGIV